MRRHVIRTIVLLVSHLLIMFDCYILALPMGFLMIHEVIRTGHWAQIVAYALSLFLIWCSFIFFKRAVLRDLLYLGGMIGLLSHWVIVGETAAYKFHLSFVGVILPAGFFLATVATQFVGIIRRTYHNIIVRA